MPTFNGWTIITMPTVPAAPASIEFIAPSAVAMSKSLFTGQQQIQNWGTLPMEINLNMPAMPQATAEAWITFLRALDGMANVFQFGAAFAGQYASSIGSRYWRLRNNSPKWSVSDMRVFGIQLELIEAK